MDVRRFNVLGVVPGEGSYRLGFSSTNSRFVSRDVEFYNSVNCLGCVKILVHHPSWVRFVNYLSS